MNKSESAPIIILWLKCFCFLVIFLQNREETKVPRLDISVQHVGLEIAAVQTLHFKGQGGPVSPSLIYSRCHRTKGRRDRIADESKCLVSSSKQCFCDLACSQEHTSHPRAPDKPLDVTTSACATGCWQVPGLTAPAAPLRVLLHLQGQRLAPVTSCF